MSDSLELLKTDAAETLARGMNCDRLVLRAIGLGFDTRARIKEAIGFDYAAIEKALEREAGAIRKSTRGPIERLTLASENGNGTPKGEAFNPWPPREAKPEATCEQCGAPRSPASGKICRDCYLKNAEQKRTAKKKKESVSPAGYIEEKPETAAELRERIAAGVDEPSAPIVTMKIAAINSKIGAQSISAPNAVLADDAAIVAPVNVRIGIQGKKAWLETDEGAVIANIEIEDIQFSTVFDIHVKFKFKGD